MGKKNASQEENPQREEEEAVCLKILRTAAEASTPDFDPNWYKILDLEPFSQISSIKKQYKKLALILHPDKKTLEASGEAFKLVNDAFQVLSDRNRRKKFDVKLRVALQAEVTDEMEEDTFSTNCSRCRLNHRFNGKYTGQNLVCSSCRKSCKAVAEQEEMTLSEMRQKLRKKKEGNKKRKVREDNSKEEQKILVLRNEDMEVMNVEDSDFYDFDIDRAERSFKSGQVWAIYDDDDGMPRHYGLIEEVVSVNPFEVKMSWLDLQKSHDQSLISWEKTGFHVSCGRFKAYRKDKINLVNVFSHIAKSERVAREIYRIYPHKGSVWALYKLDELETGNRFYEIVVFLTSYSEMHGISMVYLEKVDGFKTVFKRKDIGHHAVKWIEKFDYRQFSHQIPARKLCDDDAVPDHLKNCWELDPAALPPNLLAVQRIL